MNKIKLIIIALFLKTFTYSQSNNTQDSLLVDFDNKISLSSMPYNNGVIDKYFDITIKKDNHRYFETPNFEDGKLIYKDQQYSNIKLKYDLFQDKLIIKIESVQIEINSDDVSYFKIKNSIFENLKFNKDLKIKKGFYKNIKNNTSIDLYVRYSKFRKKTVVEDNIKLEYFIEDTYIAKKIMSIIISTIKMKS